MNKKASSEYTCQATCSVAGSISLFRFNDLMGTLFATQAVEIRDQVKILNGFLQGPDAVHYRTIHCTIAHETANPSLLEPKAKNPSGSRTLLHLHRTLAFFTKFVRDVVTLADEGKLPSVCLPAYEATLAKYHSWLLSKASGLAIRTLPTKAALYAKVSKYPYEETVTHIAAMVKAMERVFAVTDDLFTQASLHTLPF